MAYNMDSGVANEEYICYIYLEVYVVCTTITRPSQQSHTRLTMYTNIILQHILHYSVP